ncbi:amino acid permease [bacterium]|nr:MAG: amino acid permease [bacterium]
MVSSPHPALGRLHAVVLYVGAVLGSGVLIVPALAADLAGPASIMAWIAMAIAALPMALTMSTLAARFPGGGGVSTFVEQAFGSGAGAFVGWLFLLAIPFGAPISTFVAAAYAVSAFGLPARAVGPLAAALLAGVLAVNYRGMRAAAWLQVGVVGAVAALLAVAVAGGAWHVRVEHFTPFAPHGIVGVGRAAAILFWSFIGWEAVTHLSGEFRDPRRDLVPAVSIAAAIITVLYVGTAVVTVGTGSYGGGRSAASLVLVMRAALGPAAGWATGILALACVSAMLVTYLGGAASLARSLAQRGLAPAFLGAANAVGAPAGGLLAIGVLGGGVLVALVSNASSLQTLILLPSASFIAVYLLGTAAGVKLAPSRGEAGMAWFAFATSALVYPFLGWGALYPLVVAIPAWLTARRRQRAATGSVAESHSASV